jgi:Ca-activated chloride channel family protein
MSFGAPQWFWGLLLIPILALVFIRGERRGAERLCAFVSPRLLPQLVGTVNRFRRRFRFALILLGLALALISRAQPRWGYTFEDVKRKGLDLLLAVDTSRSMLSNDVAPNRLERVKLAAQDLINELQGDRIGLIAFAGRAFLQAPLTIDYEAATESINDLDTKTIPEGGTNISEAIALAVGTFGKSATGNRALIILTDGEELSGDAVKNAKAAAETGVRIFTVGVGTPQGSLIPITGEGGETAFVKDSSGQVVKSKLDEKRLRDIAQATGGFYLPLESGPRTAHQLYAEGLAKMQAADIDARLSRKPIERYEWPLTGAMLMLAMSMLIGERKRVRVAARLPRPVKVAVPVTALVLLSSQPIFATAPGLDAYRDGKFNDAYTQFQQTLKEHPQSRAEDKLEFDSGAAAYKMKDYGKALDLFSQALLSKDPALQSKSYYNLGNTLYERGEAQKSDEKKLSDWTNALQHYEGTLKLEPQNKEAKDNYDYVKKKIEELKNKREHQPPPTPTPPPKQQKNDQQSQSQDQQQSSKNRQQQENEQQQKQQQQQQQQSQEQSKPQSGQNQKPDNKQDQPQAKNEEQKSQQQKPNESPSPSPGGEQQPANRPSPSPGEKQTEASPTPGGGENETPSPSPGEGAGEGSEENPSLSATPTESPQKKLAGEIKGAAGEKPEKPPDKAAQIAGGEPEKEGQMSEQQAERLLQSMKDEERRVQLDERKPTRHVYNDW